MKINKIYDNIAKTYNQQMSANILNQVKHIAFDVVARHCKHLTRVLGLGVGDGSELRAYKDHYPSAEYHGLDISKNMLKKAEQTIGCHTYLGDIGEASQLVKKRDFDLIIAYFVISYTTLPCVLAESHALLGANGYLSILTSTKDSFPHSRDVLMKRKSINWFDKLFFPHFKKVMRATSVPDNLEHLKSVVTSHGYQILESRQEEIPVIFHSDTELFDFFINGGWFASVLSHPLFPETLLRRICRRGFQKYISFPYQDTLKVASMLGQKL